MNLKEVEKIVAGIQQSLFKNSNSYSVGLLKSSIRGSGLQFKEHQVYSHGDDVRFIDWKLSAKTTQTYVKTFEEERNVEITTIIDVSPTLMLGSNHVSKLQTMFEIIFLIFLLTKQSNDKQKIVLMGGLNYEFPAKSGEEGIVILISYFEKLGLINSAGKINLDYEIEPKEIGKKNISLIKSFIAKKKQVIYLTDFNNVEDWDSFNKLLSYKNFHCFKITSPIEELKNIPMSITSKKGSLFQNLKRLSSDELVEPESNLKIKKISTDERYLEKFIKEMK